MSDRPAISVLIPLYNAADYVLRSVGSVFAQSFQDFEIVLIDDGSMDDGPSRVTDKHGSDPRLRLITQANAGVSAARNRGLKEMRSDLAVFLDADDEWLPEHLEHVLETNRAFSEAGIIGCGYRMICRNGYVSETAVAGTAPKLVENYFQAASSARRSSILTMSSCAITRRAYDRLGGFVEGERYGEDTEFQARYAFHLPVACHPGVTAVYHREIATSAVGRCADFWPGDATLLARRYAEWSSDSNVDSQRLKDLEEYVATTLYEAACAQIGRGRCAEALTLLAHPLLVQGKFKMQATMAGLAARGPARRLARLYYRVSRSRLLHRSSSSHGISFRLVSLFRLSNRA